MNHSYSELSTFEQCPFKHKLMYIDGHYFNIPGIATDFGTIIHETEESMGNSLINGDKINYNDVLNILYRKIDSFKNTHKDAIYNVDKTNRTYDGKFKYYIRNSLHRTEQRIKNNKYQLLGCEVEFNFEYKGFTFHGFIDRLMKKDNIYIIEDIKTYPVAVKDKDLQSPLQFVIYTLAVQNKYKTNNIICNYDLPLCSLIQNIPVNFMVEGKKKLDSILNNLNKVIKPHPGPLCYWCPFSGTYPNQPEEAKGLCPYYCLWTKENKTKKCNSYWTEIKQ